jgi:hypothetical protein
MSCATGPLPPRSFSCAWASVVDSASTRSPRRTTARAPKSSMLLATHTVQVTSEATARPIMTAFTMVSACRNMPQGERSCGNAAMATELSPACAKAEVGNAAHAQSAASARTRVPTDCPERSSATPTLLTLALAGVFSRRLSSMPTRMAAKAALTSTSAAMPGVRSGFSVRRMSILRLSLRISWKRQGSSRAAVRIAARRHRCLSRCG